MLKCRDAMLAQFLMAPAALPHFFPGPTMLRKLPRVLNWMPEPRTCTRQVPPHLVAEPDLETPNPKWVDWPFDAVLPGKVTRAVILRDALPPGPTTVPGGSGMKMMSDARAALAPTPSAPAPRAESDANRATFFFLIRMVLFHPRFCIKSASKASHS